MVFSDYSVEQLQEVPALQLGGHGFCFLAAELLSQRYPEAELWRLTDKQRSKFSHVYLRVRNVPLDLKGFRDEHEMRSDLDVRDAIAEAIDPKAVCGRFYPYYSMDQLGAVRVILSAYIDEHADLFGEAALLAHREKSGRW